MRAPETPDNPRGGDPRVTDNYKAKTYKAVAPSNIALTKYWGKRSEETQWPANDSLSMTLSEAVTQTTAQVLEPDSETLLNPTMQDLIIRDQVVLENAKKPGDKAWNHLIRLRNLTGFKASLKIKTSNNFPADCGIASSASGLLALTIASLAAWTGARDLDDLAFKGYPKELLASWARLGSGSACRSIYGGFVEWEAGPSPLEQRVHQVPTPDGFALADLIVLLSKAAKTTSSTLGHRHAWTSPLYSPRLAGHPQRHQSLKRALLSGDIQQIGDLLELEALEMHSVMMTAHPPTNYWAPHTSEVLAFIRRARSAGKIEAWFTVDAGPNVHVLCTLDQVKKTRRELQEFLDTHLGGPTESSSPWEILSDQTGGGPRLTIC